MLYLKEAGGGRFILLTVWPLLSLIKLFSCVTNLEDVNKLVEGGVWLLDTTALFSQSALALCVTSAVKMADTGSAVLLTG